MKARIRRTFNLPDLDVELLGLSHLNINAISAEKYRSEKGCVFLAGDAAHRIPPFGALGLYTGLSDVFNLVWKLDWALKGLAKRTCSIAMKGRGCPCDRESRPQV